MTPLAHSTHVCSSQRARSAALSGWLLAGGTFASAVCSAACSAPATESPTRSTPEQSGEDVTSTTAAASPAPSALSPLDDTGELPGREFRIELAAGERAFASLAQAKQVEASEATQAEAWDLAFEGFEVFTNSGPSGTGQGGAFGPNGELDFLFDSVPVVPFLQQDAPGGAFLDWYAYDGSTHQLYSRHHVYGVQAGDQLWKVQILGYYGEQLGAPVSALYRLRYAPVSSQGVGKTVAVENLDATAGYPKVTEQAASGCLNLESGESLALTPAEATASRAWQLCLRRDRISVNGGIAGPGGVNAVDLMAAHSAQETLQGTQQLDAESTAAEFNAVDYAALTHKSLDYQGDRVISMFTDRWLEGSGKAAKVAPASWLVLGADGQTHYSVVFRNVLADAAGVTAVTLRVRELKQP